MLLFLLVSSFALFSAEELCYVYDHLLLHPFRSELDFFTPAASTDQLLLLKNGCGPNSSEGRRETQYAISVFTQTDSDLVPGVAAVLLNIARVNVSFHINRRLKLYVKLPERRFELEELPYFYVAGGTDEFLQVVLTRRNSTVQEVVFATSFGMHGFVRMTTNGFLRVAVVVEQNGLSDLCGLCTVTDSVRNRYRMGIEVLDDREALGWSLLTYHGNSRAIPIVDDDGRLPETSNSLPEDDLVKDKAPVPQQFAPVYNPFNGLGGSNGPDEESLQADIDKCQVVINTSTVFGRCSLLRWFDRDTQFKVCWALSKLDKSGACAGLLAAANNCVDLSNHQITDFSDLILGLGCPHGLVRS